MMKRAILLISTFLCTSVYIYSQAVLEVRMVPTNTGESADVLCFDTQFKNTSEQSINLADQNYRLFYDAINLKLIDKSLTSFLPESTYQAIDLNQTLHNIDARGYGDLKFGQNLGFVNYSIKLTHDEDKDEVITMPAHSPWMSTTNICFQSQDIYGPVNIIWAREGLTSGYATAFTEISAVSESEMTSSVEIQIYHDFVKLSDGTGVNDPMVLQSTQNY